MYLLIWQYKFGVYGTNPLIAYRDFETFEDWTSMDIFICDNLESWKDYYSVSINDTEMEDIYKLFPIQR